MPRSPRLVVPGVPLHITQRGVDRGPTFIADEDFALYRWALRLAAAESGCAVHAYALMPNHIHLLVTPADAGSAALLMQSLGRRYVRYFNTQYHRTGTLWEGRFRSEVVNSGPYVLACYRYIEQNPVRAGIVDQPAEYPWSSHRHNALGLADPVVTPHALYEALGTGGEMRFRAYRALFGGALAATEVGKLRAELRDRPTLRSTTYRQFLAAPYERRTSRRNEEVSISSQI